MVVQAHVEKVVLFVSPDEHFGRAENARCKTQQR